MRKILCLLAFCLSFQVFAQYQELNAVTVGKDFKGKGKWNNTLLNAVKNDGSIYSVAYRAKTTKKLVVDVFDAKMNHKKQYYIDAEKKYVIQSGKFIGNDLMLLGIDGDKSIAKTFKVDFKEEKLIEMKEVFNFEEMRRTKGASAIQFGGLIAAFARSSADQKRDIDQIGIFESSPYGDFYMYSRDLKSEGNKREMHQIVVLDADYNFVYDQQINLEVEDKLMEMLSFNVDENGNVVVIAKKYEQGKRKEGTRKKRDKKEANYHMEFIIVNQNDVLVQKFQEDGIFINSLSALVDNNEVFVGCYYSDEKQGRSKGVLTAVYELSTLERTAFNKTPFTDEVISSLTGVTKKKRLERKKRKEDTKLEGHSLLIGNDGSIVFIGEEDYVVTHSSYSGNPPSWRYSYTYHFDDILVTKINPDGSLGYFKVIDKTQSSAGGYIDIHSFSSFLVNGNVNLFLNAETVTEEDDSIYFKTKKEKKMSLFNVQLDAEGNITHKKVLKVKKGDNIAMGIRKATMLKDIGFITSGNDGRTKRFMKVLF